MEHDAFPMEADERLHTNLTLLFACWFLVQSQVIEMLYSLQWNYLTMWKCFIFPLLCCAKQEEKALRPHFCEHLEHTPAAKHAGFPHQSPSAPAQQECILLPPAHGKAIQPHNAAVGKDVNSFSQSFLWYFIGDCVSSLMIPTFIVQALNRPQTPLMLLPLCRCCWREPLLKILQNCLQMSHKIFVSKKSRKW